MVFGFLLGALALLSALFYAGPGEREERKSYAYALGFVAYRNAVNAHALEHKTPGTVPASALDLPAGFTVGDWTNAVVSDGSGGLICYVYAPSGGDEILAIQALLHDSAAVGWNNHGSLYRNGSFYPLPDFIPHGSVVSLIGIH
jgi:hypothetical protein